MKTFLSVMIFAVGLVWTQSAAFADLPEPKGKTENANIVAGRKAIDAKDFKAAVGHFTKAVQEDPKNADAQSMLGYSYRKLGTFDKSMEHYQTALKKACPMFGKCEEYEDLKKAIDTYKAKKK